MKRHFLTASLATMMAASPALAHHGMIIPNDPMISQEDGRSVALIMSFAHPFELDGTLLETPVAFSVTREGTTSDLLGSLQSATVTQEQG